MAHANSKSPVRIKRVYLAPASTDGMRVLVDRLWPRGLSKDAAAIDLWLKDLAPSNELRHWFGHEPARWPEFQRRYHAELDANAQVLAPLLDVLGRQPLSLLFGAKEQQHNNAVALVEYLIAHRRMTRAQLIAASDAA